MFLVVLREIPSVLYERFGFPFFFLLTLFLSLLLVGRHPHNSGMACGGYKNLLAGCHFKSTFCSSLGKSEMSLGLFF